ncbi:hypothetical protein EUTSA_v10019688mg [Eutrema salsugineum]|uniref:Uncharacterized protein n=1 Tax=Eutrema salsugineum TaxID=72664 RepID=V4JPD2_EUTSA|nr:uncharacterized protein LOC18008448 [Eutrema salsugineum]ESQ26990.1 hypothetical protein EUTSA_v10019688mg [Eutrema salsugineum]
MAEADPDSSDTSELVDLKHISSSAPPLFSFFVGFGAKDSDAGRSPTSPLDFANFGGFFSPRSPAPRFGHRNKWVCDKVGLSVLCSSIGKGDEDDSFRRENIVLAPQIKVIKAKLSTQLFDPCLKSYSLPKNYAVPPLSGAQDIHPQPCDPIWDTIVAEDHNSPRRSSSSPMDIIPTQAYSRSLSAREMALSEDYTCIISHGPNPKTTHIFGDCILDCDPKDLKEIEEPEADSLPGDSFSRQPQDFHTIHIHSEASAEKETEKAGVEEDSLDISSLGSSCNEDLFPLAMPLSS